MSMANLIVQQDRAYLMSDSGYYAVDGSIACLSPKMLVMPELSLALVSTGHLLLDWLGPEINKREWASRHQFLGSLSKLVYAAYETAGLDFTAEPSRILIAYYDHDSGHPGGYEFFTAPKWGEGKPWRLHQSAGLLQPPVDVDALYGADLCDADAFDPLTEALPLIEAQRLYRGAWYDHPGASLVAGDISLTTVSAEGIEIVTLHSFPDGVGEKVAA